MRIWVKWIIRVCMRPDMVNLLLFFSSSSLPFPSLSMHVEKVHNSWRRQCCGICCQSLCWKWTWERKALHYCQRGFLFSTLNPLFLLSFFLSFFSVCFSFQKDLGSCCCSTRLIKCLIELSIHTWFVVSCIHLHLYFVAVESVVIV